MIARARVALIEACELLAGSCAKVGHRAMHQAMERSMKRILFSGFVIVAAAAGMVWPAHAQSKDKHDRRVVIINDRTSDMTRLYGSRTTTGDWEENIITTPIRSGSKRVINFDDGSGACTFDFRAIFRDNLTAHKWSINVCREEAWRVVD